MPVTYAWADRLRILATWMVIAIHVSGPLAEQLPDFNTWAWWTANWWDAASRPSVPIFVLLSGALLLPKEYATSDFLKKRLTRVAVPALFWMGIYLFYGFLKNGQPDSLLGATRRVVEGPVHYHLWFIYLIVGLYFLYPILRPWVRQARDRDYLYLFALCAAAAWGYKILWTFWGIGLGMYWETFSNNVGYFVLGAYLVQKPLPGEPTPPSHHLQPWRLSRRQLLWLSVGLIVVGTSITAFGTYWASMTYNNGKFHPYFYDYLTPNVGMAVIGWFLLARLAWNARPLLDAEREFSNVSFGVYLVHVLMLDWWSQCGYWFGAANPGTSIPVVVSLVAVSGFLAVKFIRVLPYGDRIT